MKQANADSAADSQAADAVRWEVLGLTANLAFLVEDSQFGS
jgi:hypothetical protein